MQEEWTSIREFPGYTISSEGRVCNEKSGQIMALTRNQRGILIVGMMKNLLQHKRSVAVLVAKAFLPRSTNLAFDTPIHVDGDKSNVSVTNLAWRPNWFARKYHLQFETSPRGFSVPVIDVKTREIYPNSWEAAVKNGLLEIDVVNAISHNTVAWPTFQKFELYEE